MEHPFTAHIESPSSGGEWLREGEDYSSSDYEYDSDEEEFLQLAAPSQEVNESLTKKKFCQSAKIFYQIFSTVNQYESFLKFVSKTKKHIFRIIFRLFLEAIPEETRFKIPEELWEKIWKFTQNAHFKYKSQVPICSDQNYFRAGFRAAGAGLKIQQLEKERLSEMFGSLGNLHMLVFEVLFKNPHLLQPTALLELEVGGLSECFSAAVWRECVQVARTSVLRLQQLDNALSEKSDGGNSRTRKHGDVELSYHLSQGAVHVSDRRLDVDESALKLGPAASLLVSEFPCPYVCLPGSYHMEEDDRLGLMILVIDVEDGCKVRHTIYTPVRYEHYLIEVGSHRVIRNNESGWKKSFYLTRDRLSFASKMSEPGQEVARVWSVALGGEEGDVIKVGESLAESVMEAPGPGEKPSRNTRALAVSHSEAGLCLVHQSPYTAFTRVTVHSVTTGETLLAVPFHEDVTLLHSGSPSRVLLRSQSRCVLLFSLQSGEVVFHWKEADLNTSFNVPQESSWSALFDTSSSKHQLCLFTNTMSGFSLNHYDVDNEMARPVVISSGKMSEGVLGLGPCCRLMNGNLITNTKRDNLGEFGGSLQSHQISSYYLPRKTKYNILSMGQGSRGREEEGTLLNINSARWTDPCEGVFWDPERRPVFALSRTKLGVLLETGRVFRILDIGQSPAEIISCTTKGDTGTNGVKQDDLRKKKLEISKELAEKDETYVGTVIDWKGTYGFMKSNGKAKHLGKIYFHINDVQNKQTMKKSLKKGQKLEFKIVYNSCDDSFKTSVSKCINNE